MNTTHDDIVTTWRDLADALTPEQIAEMEYCERENIPPGIPDPEQGRLNCARALVRHNLVQALCADIAPPADATANIRTWEDWADGTRARMYTVGIHRSGDIALEVYGVQHDDGRIERAILLPSDLEDVKATEARHLAAALIEAADELDRL